jgi:DnaJ family protein A protein 3
LDDAEFEVTVNDVIDCDHVMRVPGKGMPRRNGKGFGDLYITFEVDFPDKLTNEQKQTIAEILPEEDDDSSSDNDAEDKGGEL